MTRYALVYGGLSGAIIIAVILAGLTLSSRDGFITSEYFGYLVMLVAMVLIFVGVKRYRDVERGGVIRFFPALGVASLTALVALVAYVLFWEAYLAATGYRFFDEFAALYLERLRASGASPAELAETMANIEWGRGLYAHWYTRVAITFTEPLPVALPVALLSAVLVRNPRFLPARG